ncbi:hypothetical protein STSP_00960 [Streptomyces jeddahensis]|uniref:Uncharacterized protein n=1 Tax=Streptomyces jeddahensis TaxID=1716141 RepID=A0A177I075_9ACTN|nr:hypothetical protein STSP_00960 [Streptomyces jeddahensis]
MRGARGDLSPVGQACSSRHAPAHPGGGPPYRGCDTCRMPVLDPNPQNGQKKLLLVFGAMLAITVIIGIIASIASP